MRNPLGLLLLCAAILSPTASASEQDIKVKGFAAAKCLADAGFLGYTFDVTEFAKLVEKFAAQMTLQGLLTTTVEPQNEQDLLTMKIFNKGYLIGAGEMQGRFASVMARESGMSVRAVISKQYETECSHLIVKQK